MGLVVRSLHSVQHMLQSSMDQGQSVASFRREVRAPREGALITHAALITAPYVAQCMGA